LVLRRFAVCLDTPHLRAISSVARPASTYFSATVICASLCLLFALAVSPFVRPKSFSISHGLQHSRQKTRMAFNRMSHFGMLSQVGKKLRN
jgi:hypothetical protein